MISEPPDRVKSRRWGLLVAFVLTALVGYAVQRHISSGDRTQRQIDRGIEQLHLGIVTEDDRAFEAATQHFARANPSGLIDRYPAFLLHTAEEIAQLPDQPNTADDAAAADRRYLRAIARRDWENAEKSLRQLENPEQRRYMLRLVDRLRELDAQESASSDGTS